MDRDAAMALRGASVRAAIAASADEGETQTLDVEAHEGMARAAVEVLQPYGLATRAPEGAVTLLIAVGGDQGDMVALPPSCPGTRFGRLGAGEVALYDQAGNRVYLRAGGVIEVMAATKVVVDAPEVEIVATSKVTITAPLVQVVGDLVVTGDVSDAAGSMQEMRDVYNAHTNPNDGPPPQKMT